jgi:hypothetical protein
MCDLWWTECHWDRFSEFFCFPLSVSFHRGCPYSFTVWEISNRPVGGHTSDLSYRLVLFVKHLAVRSLRRKYRMWQYIIIIIIIIIISGSTVLVRILAASHRRLRNLIKTLCITPLDEWSARRKGLYLHKITQQQKTHRNTKTNIHVSSGIRTHDSGNQVPSALDRAAAGMGKTTIYRLVITFWVTGNVCDKKRIHCWQV